MWTWLTQTPYVVTIGPKRTCTPLLVGPKASVLYFFSHDSGKYAQQVIVVIVSGANLSTSLFSIPAGDNLCVLFMQVDAALDYL